MDELDLLRDLRSLLRDLRSEVPAAPADLSRGRAALVKEIEGDRTGRHLVIRLPVRRTAWLTATVVAAAVALVLVVTQGVVGRVGRSAAGVSVSGSPASVAPSPTPPGQPAPTLEPAPVTSGGPTGPIRPDQYVFIDEFLDGPSGFGGPWMEQQSWLSVDGTRPGMIREGQVGGDTWTERSVGSGGCPLAATPSGQVSPSTRPVQPICAVTPAYHPDMPTTVDAMSAYITQLDKARRPDVPPYGGLVILLGEEILQAQYLSPASLSAMFNALKTFPDLSAGTDAVDAMGRPGLSINYDTPDQLRVELMFDANTYAYHGIRQVYLKDGDGHRAGDLFGTRVMRQIAIVDRIGQLP